MAVWHEFWGGFNNTGPYHNVVLGGSPSNTMNFGIPLQVAHANGYGYGVQFIDNGNYNVTFKLNLIGCAVTDAGVYVPNRYYVTYGGRYNWKLIISVSSDGGRTYRTLFNQNVFSHADTWTLNYASGWQTTAINSQYEGSHNIPRNTTHVKIELQGESATLPHSNVFRIDQIIEDFRPFAVRKGGKFRTLDVEHGKLQIRQNDEWVDEPIMHGSQIGKEEQGSCWIRKGGKWVGQGKVGE